MYAQESQAPPITVRGRIRNHLQELAGHGVNDVSHRGPPSPNHVGIEMISPMRSNTTAFPSRPSPVNREWLIKRFWQKHITVVVEFDECRDHLALERTFLAYLRTALMMAIVGTLVAQLYALQQSDSGSGYPLLGKPMASVCYCSSILTVFLGAIRAWRQQRAMINGKVLSGGFEITILAMGFLALVIVFLGLVLALDTIHETSDP